MRNGLRGMIVDDEPLARVRLARLLSERGFEELVEADDVPSARNLLDAQPELDVVFLDVQMPGENGFQLLENRVLPCPVVFTTAYEEYAVRAFEVEATDFLLKPIAAERLDQALKRVLASGTSAGEPSVLVRDGAGLRIIPIEDIFFVAAADDYSELHLADGSSVLTGIRTVEWEERLAAHDFFRVHRTTVASLRHARDLVRGSRGQWELEFGAEHPKRKVARRRVDQLKTRLERLVRGGRSPAGE